MLETVLTQCASGLSVGGESHLPVIAGFISHHLAHMLCIELLGHSHMDEFSALLPAYPSYQSPSPG